MGVGRKQSGGTWGVKNIIAVASGKGGVGKSTTALNLARALAFSSHKVGFLDADIYGPSLDVLNGVHRPQELAGVSVVPPEVAGIRFISASMFSSGGEKPQILRGPMVANLVRQFLEQVLWGELDYLVIDYPPGTGDIQLTISQAISLSGAIVVTTPQEMALADVRKTLRMFEVLKVPVIGVVENMSFFLCDGCEKKHEIFGSGGGRALANRFGLPLLGEIPFATVIRASSDTGQDPVRCSGSEGAAEPSPSVWYQGLAETVREELERLKGLEERGLGSFSLKWQREGCQAEGGRA